ncbi:putative pilin glycosylation protein [Halobacteriovorax marinus SJ]|uniref:Pilin glycosylation protein n=1 Tax=Halobacteriovorax marinus (strain ATCC BAA-682 / DSM 15412 / SJ) TaxID=862908 RepID=E1WZU3_HALMS|nr:aminotransferase class V-fold PLP-dependent enzyme [Halobacteriovorax marinus]CBW27879.1 putative pilin glycosylation protein [Halobacteriovorax marinus SJ]
MKIPRAYYYMNFFEPLKTCLRLVSLQHKRFSKVQEFEERYKEVFGNRYISLVSHARTGFYFCLKSLGLEEGDEILMTPINIPDMLNMARICGLKECLVDLKKETYSIDLADAQKKLSPKTRILFLTHLNGIVPNMDDIVHFCKENDLILIQDCTQIVNAKYKGRNLEEYSDYTISSLCDLKVIHTHIGGVITYSSSALKEKVDQIIERECSTMSASYFFRFLVEDMVAVILLNRVFFTFFIHPTLSMVTKLIGIDGVENFTKGKGLKIGPFYLFKGLFGGGGNVLKKSVPKGMLFSFSNLQASIGLKRLSLFKDLERRRIRNSKILYKSLAKHQSSLPSLNSSGSCVFWKFPFLTEHLEELQRYLSQRGVDSARSNLKCFNEIKEFHIKDTTPVASELSRNTLYIPAHPYLEEKDMLRISKYINDFFRNNS